MSPFLGINKAPSSPEPKTPTCLNKAWWIRWWNGGEPKAAVTYGKSDDEYPGGKLKMAESYGTSDDESLNEVPKAAVSYGKSDDESLRNDDSEEAPENENGEGNNSEYVNKWQPMEA